MALGDFDLKGPVIKLFQSILRRADLSFTRYSTLQTLYERSRLLEQNSRAQHDMNFLSQMPDEQIARLFRLLSRSKSQIRQDLFALSKLGFKRDGYFVEFGATNGLDASNTYLLEKNFGWSGILAEPARCWHSALNLNRNCNIETNCVWSRTGETLVFHEVTNPDLSTIAQFAGADHHGRHRSSGRSYEVQTISLLDLLRKYEAPEEIDYLSIDTEGSEFEILSAFDFGTYRFRVITCEHNYSSAREKLQALLEANGYCRKMQEVSQFDDWYVSA
jgi:FkbM family methyltransferase